MLPDTLLETIACPFCKGKLDPAKDCDKLLCQHCNLAFPVKEGIPLLLVDAAEKIHDES